MLFVLLLVTKIQYLLSTYYVSDTVINILREENESLRGMQFA